MIGSEALVETRLNIAGRLLIAALPMCSLAWSANGAAQQLEWSLRPYRVHLVVAVEGPGGAADLYAETLPKYLAERAAGAIGPLWELDVQLAAGVMRHRALYELETFHGDPDAAFGFKGDKLVFLGVSWRADGYVLLAREFDSHVRRWGPLLRREAPQHAALPEQLFNLLWQVVAPLAHLDVDLEDPQRAILTPRGSSLPRNTADVPSIGPGEVMLPVLRRTTRTGELAPDGIRAIPWTYIETVETQEDGRLVGRIHSGTRRPLGAGRRGRIEQVAIVLRQDAVDTMVTLVSRSNPQQPLVGYEVRSHDSGSDEKNAVLVGLTDGRGAVRVGRTSTPVQFLTIKNGGSPLARLPIVPGVEPRIEVRVADDQTRFQAEVRLAALREELIDVVARRNILVARVRQKMDAGDFKTAQELLTAIEQLPGHSQFNQELTRERRLQRASDARAQQRIEQLIAGTEIVLNQFLDVRPIRELQQEFRTRQSQSDGG